VIIKYNFKYINDNSFGIPLMVKLEMVCIKTCNCLGSLDHLWKV
jgi:hypothetical protein